MCGCVCLCVRARVPLCVNCCVHSCMCMCEEEEREEEGGSMSQRGRWKNSRRMWGRRIIVSQARAQPREEVQEEDL